MNPYNLKGFQYKPGFDYNTFDTDHGVTYSLYFQDISGDGVKTYSFGFEPVNVDMKDLPADSRVSETIFSVINSYMTKYECVIVYYPLDQDHARIKLFDFWYRKMSLNATCGEVLKSKVAVAIDEGTIIHFCILSQAKWSEYVKKIVANENLPQMWEYKFSGPIVDF